MSYQVFDIETVPLFDWEDLSDQMANLWIKKHPEDAKHYYNETASFDPIFSKVVCVSSFTKGYTKIESFCMNDEKQLLELFADRLSLNNGIPLVGHYINKFDIPFLAARYAINGIKLPASLKSYGKKPWELNRVDTKEVWDSGSYKGLPSSSLNAVCVALGIQSPKYLINGSDVKIMHREGRFEDIENYCEGDVAANTKVYLRMLKLGMI